MTPALIALALLWAALALHDLVAVRRLPRLPAIDAERCRIHRQWPGQKVALKAIATLLGQPGLLLGRLNAFSDHIQSQGFG